MRTATMLTIALFLGAAAAADEPRIEAGRAAADAVADPVAAVTTALQDAHALRKLGDIAVERSREASIRQLGTVVRNDAEQAAGELRGVARQMQLNAPSDMASDVEARVSDLEKRRPDESFDRALLDEMLREQRHAAGALEHVSGEVSPDRRGAVDGAARSFREAERETAIKRKPLKE